MNKANDKLSFLINFKIFLGEEKLVEIFPCFTLLVEKYNQKMFAKRSKWERDLMKDGKVESKSMIETKGRMVTSAGQFFYCCKRLHHPLKRLYYKIFLIVKRFECTFNSWRNWEENHVRFEMSC